MNEQEPGLEMSAPQPPPTDLSMSVIARLRLQRTHPAAWLWLSVAVIVLDQTTKCPQQQGHSVIGHFLDEGVGDVGHRNAAGRCRRDINRVNPDGAKRNDAALLQLVDDPLSDRHTLGIERIGVARCGDEYLLRRR